MGEGKKGKKGGEDTTRRKRKFGNSPWRRNVIVKLETKSRSAKLKLPRDSNVPCFISTSASINH